MVSNYVRSGCPTSSNRAADRWLKNRKLKRAPTNGVNVGNFANGVEAGETKKRGRPVAPRPPKRSGDSLRDALDNAITVQERAFVEVDKAIVSGANNTSAMLAVHTKALEARFMAEKSYREEMERRGLLVEKSVIIELARRTMDAVLRRLKKLPQEKGPECNPQNALMAVGILEAEVNSIIATGRKALDAIQP